MAAVGIACAGAALQVWWMVPRSYDAAHWRTAWALFDVLLATLAFAAAALAGRGSRWAAMPASAACFGFVVDALFDCLTARGGDEITALRDLLAEIPCAVLFGAVAVMALRSPVGAGSDVDGGLEARR